MARTCPLVYVNPGILVSGAGGEKLTVEEEARPSHDAKVQFSQRSDIVHDFEWLRSVFQVRGDCKVGNDQHSQD